MRLTFSLIRELATSAHKSFRDNGGMVNHDPKLRRGDGWVSPKTKRLDRNLVCDISSADPRTLYRWAETDAAQIQTAPRRCACYVMLRRRNSLITSMLPE
jgi:hypothetical protein